MLRNQKGKDVATPELCPIGSWEFDKEICKGREERNDWTVEESILVGKKGRSYFPKNPL